MKSLSIAAVSVLAFTLCGSFVRAQDTNLSSYDEWNLAKLQRRYAKGVSDPVPWAGYWWPYSSNGIASEDYDGSKSSVSPAAKLDEIFGWNNWISSWEYGNHGAGNSGAEWWGHCNGWATAAIMEREPRKSRSFNGVKLDVADSKAILSEYWLESGSDFIGNRVWDQGDMSSDAFWDIVPAQFHLLLTNIVGRQKRSVIIDRYTGQEVWNHPMMAYEIAPIRPRDYLGPDPQYANVYRVEMTATIWWVNDEVEPNDLTPKFKWEEDEYFNKRTLHYELWVDAPLEFDSKGNLVNSGNIILTSQGYGGQWMNGTNSEVLLNSHPDFAWLPLSYAPSSGYKNPRLNDAWIYENLR